MNAIAVHTFAGGFLMGVRQAGWTVKTAYEPHDFGTATLRDLNVDVKGVGEDWAEWEVPPRVPDMVFGNPRCGGFGVLNANCAKDDKRGADCKQSYDAEQLCRFGARVHAPVVVFESVQTILTPKNRPFVDRMIYDVLEPEGYRVCHVKICAQTFGNPQYRYRYFFVAYKKGVQMHFTINRPLAVMATVGEVLESFLKQKTHEGHLIRKNESYDAQTWGALDKEVRKCMKYIGQGESMNYLMHTRGPAIFKKLGAELAYKKSLRENRSETPFGVSLMCAAGSRLKWDGPCPTLVGGMHNTLHPRLQRGLTVGEIAALMGWPKGQIPSGPYPSDQIPKGVIPAVGQWLADQVAISLGRTSGRFNYERVDGELVEARPNAIERMYDFNDLAPEKTEATWKSWRGSKVY